jgi:hypothetical protein
MLDKYLVGVLSPSSPGTSPPPSLRTSGGAPAAIPVTKVALQGRGKKLECTLLEKEYAAPDVLRLKFALPHGNATLGLPVGMHLGLSAMVEGKRVMRQYTPVSKGDAKGDVELLVKVGTRWGAAWVVERGRERGREGRWGGGGGGGGVGGGGRGGGGGGGGAVGEVRMG